MLEQEFRKNKKRKVDISWSMDETYSKLNGEWMYYYRAVDKSGDTIDFILSKKRDETATKAFFTKPIRSSDLPEK